MPTLKYLVGGFIMRVNSVVGDETTNTWTYARWASGSTFALLDRPPALLFDVLLFFLGPCTIILPTGWVFSNVVAQSTLQENLCLPNCHLTFLKTTELPLEFHRLEFRS